MLLSVRLRGLPAFHQAYIKKTFAEDNLFRLAPFETMAAKYIKKAVPGYVPSLSHHSLPNVQFIGTKFVLHELNGAGGEISRYGHVAFIDFSSYFGNSPSSFGTLIGYLKLQPSIFFQSSYDFGLQHSLPI